MNKNKIQEMRTKLMESHEEISTNLVLEDIRNHILKNLDILDGFSRVETGRSILSEEIHEIFTPDKFNPYGSLNTPYINNFGMVTSTMVPLGIVFIDVNYTIPLANYLQMIKVCIETRNSVIVKPNIEFKTLETAVVLINDILSQYKGYNKIEFASYGIYDLDIDAVVYVGNKKEFKALGGDFKKIYVGVGQWELYVDEELDQEFIKKVKEENVQLFYPQDEVFDLINQEGGNYCSAIMSSDTGKIKEFMARVDSSFKLVNIDPTTIKRANLFPEQLLKRQNTIAYK